MSIMKEALHLTEDVVQSLIFRQIKFRREVLIDRITGNVELIFADCFFYQAVRLVGFENEAIVFQQCWFKSQLHLVDCKTSSLQLIGNVFEAKRLVRLSAY